MLLMHLHGEIITLIFEEQGVDFLFDHILTGPVTCMLKRASLKIEQNERFARMRRADGTSRWGCSRKQCYDSARPLYVIT